MDSWWHLPGNQACLNNYAEALDDGQCLIITPAAHSPSGLERALSYLLTSRWDYQVTRITLPDDPGGSPISWLYEQVVHDLPPDKPRDLHNFSLEPDLIGRIILLTCPIEANAQTWLTLLNKAQTTFRSLNAWERPRIVLCLPPGSTTSLPAPDSSLSLRTYEPVCHLHEMRYLAASMSGDGFASELRLECAVQLSLWDVELCEELIRLPWEHLLSPLPILKHWAVTRGWQKEDYSTSPADPHARSQSWSGLYAGTYVWHSAWLARQDRSREVYRRLWKAQNIVIFPYIEERRAYWIEKKRHLLRPPFQTLTEILEDPADLEIGQLVFFLRTKWHTLSREERASIEWLRDARHHLAHLEPLSASFIQMTGSPIRSSG